MRISKKYKAVHIYPCGWTFLNHEETEQHKKILREGLQPGCQNYGCYLIKDKKK